MSTVTPLAVLTVSSISPLCDDGTIAPVAPAALTAPVEATETDCEKSLPVVWNQPSSALPRFWNCPDIELAS
jgi:hypothetical protein